MQQKSVLATTLTGSTMLHIEGLSLIRTTVGLKLCCTLRVQWTNLCPHFSLMVALTQMGTYYLYSHVIKMYRSDFAGTIPIELSSEQALGRQGNHNKLF